MLTRKNPITEKICRSVDEGGGKQEEPTVQEKRPNQGIISHFRDEFIFNRLSGERINQSGDGYQKYQNFIYDVVGNPK